GPIVRKPKPAPSQDEVQRIEEILTAAQRPLIIAGGGVKLAEAESTLVKFAEKTKIPVIAAFRRHDVFPNDHPLYGRSEEHTSELQSRFDLVCRLLLEKKKQTQAATR